MSDKQKILKDLARRIERIITRETKKKTEERSWGMFSLKSTFSLLIFDIFLDGLAKVFEITQKILTDGSLKYDFRGREECRNFVLNENNSEQTDLFGSANIEAWLQLQFSNKV